MLQSEYGSVFEEKAVLKKIDGEYTSDVFNHEPNDKVIEQELPDWLAKLVPADPEKAKASKRVMATLQKMGLDLAA